jgi:TIGR03009 family protein
MRHSVLATAAALLCGAALLAQQPQPQPQPAANALNQVLANWEKVMVSMDSFTAQCSLTKLNKTFQTTEVLEGSAKYLKPNRASLELRHKTKADSMIKWVFSGTEFYEYVPSEKLVRVHKMQGGGNQDNFLSLILGGMKAEEAHKRYQLALVEPRPNDQWYYYIDIIPRHAQDKAEFARARLTLFKSSYLPAQLWFEQPNRDEQTWSFPKINSNVRLQPEEFGLPKLPADWKISQMPAQNQPRVIRQPSNEPAVRDPRNPIPK